MSLWKRGDQQLEATPRDVDSDCQQKKRRQAREHSGPYRTDPLEYRIREPVADRYDHEIGMKDLRLLAPRD